MYLYEYEYLIQQRQEVLRVYRKRGRSLIFDHHNVGAAVALDTTVGTVSSSTYTI